MIAASDVEFCASVCGHLIWSVWAAVQAATSDIEFDFLSYARQRQNHYRFLKDWL